MKVNLTTTFFAALLLIAGCGNKSSKAGAQDEKVTYETYCNERYDYCVKYPDFLVPQGETESGDGQTFLSEDGQYKMQVYRDFKAITGDNPTIETAYKEDIEGKQLTEKKLEESYYLFAGKTEDKLFRQFVIYANEEYFVIRFEYPEADEKRFEAIAAHVSESFNTGAVTTSEATVPEQFITFLHDFLNDCFWDKNFDALLRDNSKLLAKYIDPKMEIIRYDSPGSFAKVYRRSDNFGFGEHTDFSYEPMVAGAVSFLPVYDTQQLSEVKFYDDNGTNVFYQTLEKLPDEMVNSETFETKPIKLPYPDAQIIAVYLPSKFQNPRAFCFVQTPNGWKLAAVDDSLFSA